MSIYMILPVDSDPEYAMKREILDKITVEMAIAVHYPLERVDFGSEFNLSAALAQMESAELVIVDLALERPSCYYELGLAQACGRPTSLVAPLGTPIHQAADRASVLFYSDVIEYESIIRSCLEALSDGFA